MTQGVSPEDGGSMFLSNVGLPTSPHGVTTQKIKIDITAVRTSNLIQAHSDGPLSFVQYFLEINALYKHYKRL
jgi:hypothetical protein